MQFDEAKLREKHRELDERLEAIGVLIRLLSVCVRSCVTCDSAVRAQSACVASSNGESRVPRRLLGPGLLLGPRRRPRWACCALSHVCYRVVVLLTCFMQEEVARAIDAAQDAKRSGAAATVAAGTAGAGSLAR